LSEDGFLGRWSRRKRGLATPEAESLPEPRPGEAPPGAPERGEEEILAELDLPVPESLGPGDDFSAFMRAGVPDWLRRRALRRLWGTNAAFANLDGLVDYGEDFTDAATVVENLQSAWQVGRGYAREAPEEAPAGADEEAAGPAGEEETPPADPAPAEPEAPPAQDRPASAAREEHPADPEVEAPAERTAGRAPAPPVAATRRRMRFGFRDSEEGAG
jgi:hypothetical protein